MSAQVPFDCSEFSLRVYEYIDAEMTPEDRERLRAHLDECGSCLNEYERDMVLKALVRRSSPCQPAPTTLRMQILARITTVSVEVRDN